MYLITTCVRGGVPDVDQAIEVVERQVTRVTADVNGIP
jgi:hypothetical protein